MKVQYPDLRAVSALDGMGDRFISKIIPGIDFPKAGRGCFGPKPK